MQDTEGKPTKLHGKPAEFTAKDFTATNFASAEDKAKWAHKFIKFILGGFQRNSFKKEIYQQLHNMFGHCAEYDINGFYHAWFEDTYKCLHWLETVTTTWLAGIGQPQFTWSDVEIKLVRWIRDNNIQDQVVEYLRVETEQKERATLKLLQDRYGVVPIASAASAEELGQLRLF